MKTSFFGWAMGIVAISAVVACGDDSPAGTGGGGEGQGGATSATTTSGNTTVGNGGAGGATTTTTGVGGAGGTGGGSDCTEVTIADLAADGAALFGLLDPAIGGSNDDYGIVEFWDVDIDGNPTDPLGSEPGSYDLSAETDYNTCGRCVYAIEDAPAAEGETAARTYFAESGTLELAEEGAAINAGYGTVTLTDVVLREAVIDENGTTFVEDGACLHITELVYDNPNPAPDEWTCNPGFYGAEDGCDCACGAYDPDCDDPESTLYNCQDGQTCDDAGVCEGVPTAWECEDAAFQDGTTCDCACGALDPDCDEPANPVEGCEAGFTCVEDTCIPPDESGLCDNVMNDDLDDSIDCAETECQDEAACTPGDLPRDSLCETHNDCDTAAGNDPLCLPGAQDACTEWCNLANDDCGAGAFCYDLGNGLAEGICLTECTDAGDCPADFDCVEVDEAGTTACLAGPPAGWTCEDAYYAGGPNDGCDCGCGIVDPDCADATVASCQSCSELSCANDGSAFGCAELELNPVDNSQCVLN